MSWLKILKTNGKDFDTTYNKNIDLTTENDNNVQKYVNELKDYDEEFNRMYEGLINDMQFDFKMLLEERCLPFMDIHPYRRSNLNHTFFEFIKNNSKNYFDIVDIVNKENDLIIKDYEKDDNEYYLDNHSDNWE